MSNLEFKHISRSGPPWSNQPAGPWICALAWIFVACALFALGGTIRIALEDGIAREYRPFGVFMLLVGGYYVALFAYVGLKGNAPSSWLPWK